MKILAIIPARGGSKGLPKKNIKILGDKPLIAWSIESAKRSKQITYTIVSTDSPEIKEVAMSYGANAPFLRPENLSSDFAESKDVLIHAIDFYIKQKTFFDFIVLLQPTSPFRKDNDIDKAIDKAIDTNADMVVSVKETSSNPYYVLFEEGKNGYLEKSKTSNYTRRQDCPPVFEYNGSIYVIKTSSLLKKDSLVFNKTVKYIMDDLHSVDIDNEIDFAFAELLIEKGWI